MKKLSVAQQGIWLGHILNENKALFNTAECIAFSGKISIAVLEVAITQAVSEAECVYCHFIENEEGEPGFVPACIPVPISTLALNLDNQTQKEREWIREWASHDIKQPMDLATQLPCRFTIITGEQSDYLYSCIHHIAVDGFGNSLLFRRIAEIYTALLTRQEVAACSYGDFDAVLDDEAEKRFSGKNDKSKNYWLEQLSDRAEPVSYCQHREPITAQFIRQSSVFNEERWLQLNTLCSAHKLSWPDMFLAALSLHLTLHTGQSQLTFGLMVMNRIGSPSLKVPCLQMNIVPLCIDLDDTDDLLATARKISQSKKQMRRHQAYRYEDLRRDLSRFGAEQRLFGPLVNIMPFDHPLRYHDVEATTLNLTAGPVEDITIEIHCQAQGSPMLDFDANPGCYSQSVLQQLQSELFELLYLWCDQPQRQVGELVSERLAEERQLALIQSEEVAPCTDILAAIRQQAEIQPDQTAIQQIGGDCCYSYRELVITSEQSAAVLRDQGIKPGDSVGIMMRRHPDLIVAMLAVLNCGAAFVPLDPEQPEERQRHILGQSKIRHVLCDSEFTARVRHYTLTPMLVSASVSSTLSDQRLSETVDSGSPAYIMFTSGSTGQPKGVVINRQSLNHFAAAAQQRYKIDKQDRVLQFAPFNFDACIEEVFISLCGGASLILRNDAMLESIPTFVSQVSENRISVLDLPTAFWNEWVVSLDAGSSTVPECLKTVIIGGEAVYPEQLSKWQRVSHSDVALINTYGPTEATVVACASNLEQQNAEVAQLPIGLPLPGVKALVVGLSDKPSHEGELLLLGPTLSSGYLGDGAGSLAFDEIWVGDCLTPVYRTGDRVRFENGQLLYLGRIDNEFKISGYRIQPGEVESHLLNITSVTEACVQGIVYSNGVRRLVAFVASGSDLQARDLKAALQSVLPAAMVPTDYQFYTSLSKTRTGKIDRKRLVAEYESQDLTVELATDTESRVGAIWRRILGVSHIQSIDNFFELGGQSLQTIQIVNRLTAEFDLTLNVSDIFDRPVLAEFCQYIDSKLQQSENAIEMVW